MRIKTQACSTKTLRNCFYQNVRWLKAIMRNTLNRLKEIKTEVTIIMKLQTTVTSTHTEQQHTKTEATIMRSMGRIKIYATKHWKRDTELLLTTLHLFQHTSKVTVAPLGMLQHKSLNKLNNCSGE